MVRKARSTALVVEKPQAGQGGHRHQQAEACDFELADAKENGVDGALLPAYCAAGLLARLDVCECRICQAPLEALTST